MFDGKRFVTAGISSSVDPEVQMFIWNLIEDLKSKIQLDYLQVFELSTTVNSGRPAQKLVHSQEIPHHRQEYILNAISQVNEKVYVIDDESHITMLLAAEY